MDNQDKWVQELLAKYPRKIIPCAEARAWAEEHDINYSDVGALCNAAGIKIIQCELGCF